MWRREVSQRLLLGVLGIVDKGGRFMTYLEGSIGKTLYLLSEKAEEERGDEEDF